MRNHRVVPAVLTLSLLFVAPIVAQQTAEELYQAGLYQEEVQGNLQQAIDLFGRILIAFPDSRAVGARAQLHIGLCYEKLGQREAQQAYRRVIADFPEHATQVAVARDRLAEIERSLAESNRQPTFRKIDIASKPRNGVLSPEGDRLAFLSEGSMWVIPLHGEVDPNIAGEPIRIADVPGAWDNGSLMSWSADGRWIAVNGPGDGGEGDVFVVPATGGEPRSVLVPPRGGHAWSYRVSLSPQGDELAFSALALGTDEEDPAPHERHIFSIPTSGGDPKKLSSSWGRLPSFSPDGEHIAYTGYRERKGWQEGAEGPRFDGDLWVVSSAGGTPSRIATVEGRLRGAAWSPDSRFIAAHVESGGTNDSREIWVFPLTPERTGGGSPVRLVRAGIWWRGGHLREKSECSSSPIGMRRSTPCPRRVARRYRSPPRLPPTIQGGPRMESASTSGTGKPRRGNPPSPTSRPWVERSSRSPSDRRVSSCPACRGAASTSHRMA
jgi:hypothetical protein